MIVVRLFGGLGNQLFQYATGRMLSIQSNAPLRMDITWFSQQYTRSFRLGYYGLEKFIATPNDLAPFHSQSLHYKIYRKVFKIIGSFIPKKSYRVINESSTPNLPYLINQPGNIYLNGYWQNENYFKTIRSQLLADLTPAKYESSDHNSLINEIAKVNSISLHVRRGDYISDPKANRIHGVLPMSYYANAIEYILNKQTNAQFYIFSDDLAWCQKYLQIKPPCKFVNILGSNREYDDLYLMSACKHHIIANSSYSWWGAWLGINPEKIIIAPQKWFNETSRDTRDLIPETWIRL